MNNTNMNFVVGMLATTDIIARQEAAEKINIELIKAEKNEWNREDTQKVVLGVLTKYSKQDFKNLNVIAFKIANFSHQNFLNENKKVV